VRFGETVNQQTDGGAIDIGGTANAQLVASSSAAFAFVEPGMRKLARVQGNAKLSINGGAIVGVQGPGIWDNEWPQDGVIVVRDGGQLTATGTQFGNAVGIVPPRWAIWADDNAQIVLKNVTIDGSKSPDDPTSGMHLEGSGTTLLHVESSVLQNNWYAVHVTGSKGAQPTVQLTQSNVDGGSYVGVRVSGQVATQLRILGTQFGYVQQEGMRLSSAGATDLAIEYSTFTNVRGAVVRHEPIDASAPVKSYGTLGFKLRGSSLLGRGGLELAATAQGQLDLGSLLEPGLNTIVTSLDSNGNAKCGLKILANPKVTTMVLAVGNTWRALTQGSNASGRYVAGRTPGTWDVTGPVACPSKGNYGVPADVTLRLDQK
jgi:hypothetical protein